MGRSSLLVEKAQGSTVFGTKGSTKKGFFRIMSKIGDPPPTPWVHLGLQLSLWSTILCGDGSVQIGTVWYLVVQGQYRAFMPLYIEKVEVWSGVTDVLQTHRRTDRQPK